MKNYFFIILLIFLTNQVAGQVLNQDSKGNSALLIQGGTIGIDLSEASLGLSYNNIFDEGLKRSKMIWGFNINAKNEKGTADLLKGGNFLPSSRGDVFIGFRLIDKQTIKNYSLISKSSMYQDSLDILHKETLKKISDTINIAIEETYSPDSILPFTKIDELNRIKEALNKFGIEKFHDFYKKEYQLSKDTLRKKVYELTQSDLMNIYLNFYKKHKEIATKKDELDDVYFNEDSNSDLVINTFFLRAGVIGNSFFVYNLTDSVELNNNFNKINYNGLFMDLGYNSYIGKWLCGVSVGIINNNNLLYLEEGKYTVRNSYNSNFPGQQLTTQKDYTAYTGEYIERFQLSFKIDALKFLPFKKSQTLAINPYYKYEGLSTLPNIHTIGFGSYIFNDNSFTIGIYLEGYDLTNSINNYINNSEQGTFYERVNIGLITKYAFSSFLFPETKK